MKRLQTTQYLTPLREGGSLPAIVEADDGERYVMKFVGAGQGRRALIAELVVGEIGRALGLRVPETVLLDLDEGFGRLEPDPEIQDLLRASVGLNLGIRYLPHACQFNPLLKPPPDPDLASAVVWFDSYVTNVDRTPVNVNLLMWHGDMWLIDHGAALYFHHNWGDYLARSRSPFGYVKDHVLLPFANRLIEADAALRQRLASGVIRNIVSLIPDEWLGDEPLFADSAEHREAYVQYLLARLEAAPIFVEEAIRARAASV